MKWLSVFLITFVSTTFGAPQQSRLKMAVLPVQLSDAARKAISDVQVIDELILTAVQQQSGMVVIGRSDMDAVLGYEKQKDLFACDETTCFAEIGGALGADKLVSIRLTRLDPKWVVTLKLVDLKAIRVESRSSEFITGDEAALLQSVPQFVRGLFAAHQGTAPVADTLSSQNDRCERGDAVACRIAGLAYVHGRGVSQQPTRAVELFEKACDADDARACNALGLSYQSGEGVAKEDLPRAEGFFSKACSLGEAHGCEALATMYSEPGVEDAKARLITNLRQRGIDLSRAACQHGDARACGFLGWSFVIGRGVSKDAVHGVELLRKACDGDDPVGCTRFGLAFIVGEGVPKDSVRGIELCQKGCDGGDAAGCVHVGMAYQYGQGTPRDYRRAAEYFESACNGGHPLGCYRFGLMLMLGNGIAKDAHRAVPLFEKACDQGYVEACRDLGLAHMRGDGVARDSARATALFEQACRGGNDTACSDLKQTVR